MAGQYRTLFRTKLRSLIAGAILLFLSLTFQFFASSYSIRVAGPFVGDIVLDNTPVVSLNTIIIEGALFGLLGIIILLFSKPRYLPFALKTVAIFIAVRAFMIAATHLGIYPNQLVPDNSFFDNIYKALDLQAGYFFSAHTGLPFLLGLVFWNEKFWRYLFLVMSVIFGSAVLLAHVHYSIDVFAAPFMVYSIFKLAQFLFEDDYALIDKSASPLRAH
jgi:hypothetical protein